MLAFCFVGGVLLFVFFFFFLCSLHMFVKVCYAVRFTLERE